MRIREKVVRFHLTDDELHTLNEKVQSTSLNREAYIRAVLKDTIPVEIPPISYGDLVRSLNHIGNNLNQIATIANSNGMLNYKEYQANANKVMNVCDLLLEFLTPHSKEKDKDNGIL